MKINKKNYRIIIEEYKKGGYSAFIQINNYMASSYGKNKSAAINSLLHKIVKEANKYKDAILHLDSLPHD